MHQDRQVRTGSVSGLTTALNEHGVAPLGPLLPARDCDAIRALFHDDARFRKTVDMAAHGYGRGRYRYFAAPLPEVVSGLRHTLYARLVPIANTWAERLSEPSFPATLEEYTARCHEAGQPHPTPLVLR